MNAPLLDPMVFSFSDVGPVLPWNATQDGRDVMMDVARDLMGVSQFCPRSAILTAMRRALNLLCAVMESPEADLGSATWWRANETVKQLDNAIAVENLLTDDDLRQTCQREHIRLIGMLDIILREDGA